MDTSAGSGKRKRSQDDTDGLTNHCWKLSSNPVGVPKAEDFKLDSELVPGNLAPNQFLVRMLCLSVDPYMRAVMNKEGYFSNLKPGDKMIGGAVGIVLQSKNEYFPVGKKVYGRFGWQEYAITSGEGVNILGDFVPEDHVSYALGVLGMPGATAYYGFKKLLEPEAGKTVFVSGAAGAVGSLVGQIGKLEGLKVVGSAGSFEKLEFLKSIGFDEVINYKGKARDDLVEEMKNACPNGIDYYFDNTGGPVTEAVILTMNRRGKVSVCGQISRYHDMAQERTVSGVVPAFEHALFKELRIEGFVVSRWKDWTEGHNYLAENIKGGKIKAREDVTVGIENVFGAFMELFNVGKSNIGKKIVNLYY